jgi:hypothetical protein
MEGISSSQESSHMAVPTFNNVEEIVAVTNENLNDSMYIGDNVFLPEKKDIGRCYRIDFVLKNTQETKRMIKAKLIEESAKLQKMIDKKMEKTTIEEQEKKIAKWECMNI